jgi:hypothetical protein
MGKFKHKHSAHCESGVVSSLLTHGGFPMSEAMAFGLGDGLAFAYLPIVKLDGMPLVAYRMMPKNIIKNVSKRLKIPLSVKTYSTPQKAKDDLIKMLNEGQIVGLQTSVYYLPYFPANMRFHFNAHNLLIYGVENNEFLISDPVFEEPFRVGIDELDKARFAKGVFAPKGSAYTLGEIPKNIDLAPIIIKSIKRTVNMMLRTPMPWIGVRGMKMMKKAILNLDKHKNKRYPALYLGHLIRMQEEIGTGGGGFRLMYAAFLLEASKIMNSEKLRIASQMMTEAGDKWREFALVASKACRKVEYSLGDISESLQVAIDHETKVYQYLKEHKYGRIS